jgi:hypothetical protein
VLLQLPHAQAFSGASKLNTTAAAEQVDTIKAAEQQLLAGRKHLKHMQTLLGVSSPFAAGGFCCVLRA